MRGGIFVANPEGLEVINSVILYPLLILTLGVEVFFEKEGATE